jgi:hypothetical protein
MEFHVNSGAALPNRRLPPTIRARKFIADPQSRRRIVPWNDSAQARSRSTSVVASDEDPLSGWMLAAH